MDPQSIFQKQVETLLQKDYSSAAGMSTEKFLEHIEPLREKVKHIIVPEVDLEKGTLPFVIVVKSELVSTEKAMALVEKDGKHGITKLFPHEPKDFQVVPEEQTPEGVAYLLVGIDRGKETINIRPQDALKMIRSEHRLPLTIDEGVAIVTQYPEFLMKNNCFSLLASRNPKDKRVPAIWINAAKHPNLGWCWDGNPHTWLGSASGEERIGQ